MALVGSIYMAGLLVSSFLMGFLSDKIGRKWTLMFAIVVGCSASLAGAFVNDYISYAVTRFFAAWGKSKLVLRAWLACSSSVG